MSLLQAPHESTEQGERLKAARKLTLLSRRAFAKKYQFNNSSYQAWEDGQYKKGISLSNAIRLAKAFSLENIDCSVEWLLNGISKPSERSKETNLLHHSERSSEDIKQKTNHFKKIKLLNIELIEAIKRNQVIECKNLVTQGANLHTLHTNELYLYSLKMFSALHFSGWYGGVLLIQMFIDLGMNPDIRNRDNDIPLHLAAWEGNNSAIKKLLDLGSSIEAANNEGTTPIMWAASNGRLSAIPLLVSLGAQINTRDYQGNTAAHWAAFKGHAGIIESLFCLGASLDIKNHQKKTPLEVAIINGQTEVVDKILHILGKV